ncbi:MAG TPA: hemolysin III family protein [Cyclobacteriaceae bacterium]|nr:hemolysin III family protein [Cyclobacteriaceae bacterium]
MKDKALKKREEIVNAATHGIGIGLALAGFIILIVQSEAKALPGLIVYGLSLILLYLASTIYHSVSHPRKKLLFKKLDHIAIFILIAGTYTPFCLSALHGWPGWMLLAAVWCLAAVGILFKVFHAGRHEVISLILYVATGWLVIVAIKPIYHSLSGLGFALLMLGGLFYSAGIIFYVSRRIRYNHAIWHLFVLAGSSFHFFSIMTLSV